MAKETDILQHAAENNFNVLLIGHHGVGKTAMVKEVFDKMGWKWKYFSASTIDPWVDLVGVPKEKDGVLELIRPADLAFDEVEAFFFDEYNRSPKKVRNAVMEVIQFGSINGKKFPNLKVVFAAINPDDDDEFTYDVEKLDPAQMDRFHIHLKVDSKPSAQYFTSTHGTVGGLAVRWWNDQTKKTQSLVSPRRLEAAVKVHVAGGDIRYVIDPEQIAVGGLVDYLDRKDPIEILDDLCTKSDDDVRKYLSDDNKLNHIKTDMLNKNKYISKLSALLPHSIIMTELRRKKGTKFVKFVSQNMNKFAFIVDPILKNPTIYGGTIVDAAKEYKKKRPSLEVNANRVINLCGEQVKVSDLVFCFSGTIGGYSRELSTSTVEGYGISVVNSVTNETTHLVVGANPGSKLYKAQQKGLKILSETDFTNLINVLSNPTTTNV